MTASCCIIDLLQTYLRSWTLGEGDGERKYGKYPGKNAQTVLQGMWQGDIRVDLASSLLKKYLCKIVCKISLEPAVQNPFIRIAVRYKGSPHKMCRKKSPGKIFAQTLYQIVFLARSLFSVQSNRTRALQEISWQDFCTMCVRFLTEIYKSDLCSSFLCKLSERDLLARSL